MMPCVSHPSVDLVQWTLVYLALSYPAPHGSSAIENVLISVIRTFHLFRQPRKVEWMQVSR